MIHDSWATHLWYHNAFPLYSGNLQSEHGLGGMEDRAVTSFSSYLIFFMDFRERTWRGRVNAVSIPPARNLNHPSWPWNFCWSLSGICSSLLTHAGINGLYSYTNSHLSSFFWIRRWLRPILWSSLDCPVTLFLNVGYVKINLTISVHEPVSPKWFRNNWNVTQASNYTSSSKFLKYLYLYEIWNNHTISGLAGSTASKGAHLLI